MVFSCNFNLLGFHASSLCNSSLQGIFYRARYRWDLRSEACLSPALYNGSLINTRCPRYRVEREKPMLARRESRTGLGISMSPTSMMLGMSES